MKADFLHSWRKALEAYGTPGDFADNAGVRQRKVEIAGQIWDFNVIDSPNCQLRRELMAKQEHYQPKRNPEEYGLDFLDLESCFLCENVVQGIDAQENHDVPNNIILDFGKFVLAPNRYPGWVGHSLLLPVEHDDVSYRVIPDSEGRMHPRVGKSLGNFVSPEYLETMIQACKDHELVGVRNHPLDAMSIPFHDHFHIFPETSDFFSRA